MSRETEIDLYRPTALNDEPDGPDHLRLRRGEQAEHLDHRNAADDRVGTQHDDLA
jgi:hypothetical protein